MNAPLRIDDNISRRILKIVAENDENTMDLSRLIDVSYTTAYKLVTGTTSPRAEWIQDICRHYKVSADWLLFGDGGNG